MGAFKESDKLKCLLWCNRHCCLCGRTCGIDIEFAHIIPRKEKGSGHIDNALPACYDCHAKVERYNKEHPKGNKYRIAELKARREQVYEEQTRHLVPPIRHILTQENRKFPKVGFGLIHAGSSLPVKVLVDLTIRLGERSLGNLKSMHYNGKKPWNMNPALSYMGGFNLPEETVKSKKRVSIEVNIEIIDQYERRHAQLPTMYYYRRQSNFWELIP